MFFLLFWEWRATWRIPAGWMWLANRTLCTTDLRHGIEYHMTIVTYHTALSFSQCSNKLMLSWHNDSLLCPAIGSVWSWAIDLHVVNYLTSENCAKINVGTVSALYSPSAVKLLGLLVYRWPQLRHRRGQKVHLPLIRKQYSTWIFNQILLCLVATRLVNFTQ